MEFWLWQPPAGSPVNHYTAGRQINPNIHVLTPVEATAHLHELVVVLEDGEEEGHVAPKEPQGSRSCPTC